MGSSCSPDRDMLLRPMSAFIHRTNVHVLLLLLRVSGIMIQAVLGESFTSTKRDRPENYRLLHPNNGYT